MNYIVLDLDENFQMVDFFKIGVRPQYYVKMHKKVKALTRITNGVLRNGLAFPMALSYFRIWCGEDAVFLTWGSDDMDILRDNMTLHQMSHKGLPKTYNLQHIFGSSRISVGIHPFGSDRYLISLRKNSLFR